MNRATKRAEANDAAEMLSLTEMMLEGLKPAQRVRICMEKYEIEPLGNVAWIYRGDLVSAAPDNQ